MSFVELRKRLKHIAGLCYGLSIDLANEIEEREEAVKNCERLQAELNGLRGEVHRLSGENYQLKYNRKRGKANE